MNPTFNEIWEQHIKSKGADFVNFVGASVLPAEAVEGYSYVVLFGKALSKEYINALRAGEPPIGRLPHKTVALNAGLGFIGKNNLLVTEQFGSAVLFGKVLTVALFETMSKIPTEPQCGDCYICVDICLGKSLQGTTWNITKKREDMMVRKFCKLCLMCMIYCPYTEKYAR